MASTRRRSPWPRGLRWRIHRRNDPLAALPDSHPARQTIILHAECRRDCVGREIPWPGHENEAFDQDWQSSLLGHRFQFSSYAYAFVSYSLVLEEWLAHPDHVTDSELWSLARLSLLDVLLGECERAALEDKNTRVLGCIAKLRRLNELHLEAIRRRIADDGLVMPTTLPACDARALLFPPAK